MEPLGLSAKAQSVYRAMLQAPDAGLGELAERVGLDVPSVAAALDELARLALVRPSSEELGELRPISPEVGLSSLLARQEAELQEYQQRVATNRLMMAQIIAEYRETQESRGNPEAEFLEGADAIRNRVLELSHNCRSEVLVFAAGGALTSTPVWASEETDREMLARGVDVRCLCMASMLGNPAAAHHARALVDAGGQVRSIAVLPLSMVVYDGQVAVLPADVDGELNRAQVLRGRGPVAVLSAFFERLWEEAAPLGDHRGRDESGLTGQERAVLTLLLKGHTDEAVARSLGVSVRTGRRITANLMNRLGARSRFQAGALAVESGWITVS
ncbi:LuxR C-terminal-related transcriptional regulator [Streptomyces abikoensis]|uniref:LuxR C-terminal-related transcriptional regulator n=1 Tax=Streptomyces abikoensis TaxID=97398 RepID=A0ABW7T6X1_9ACTN